MPRGRVKNVCIVVISLVVAAVLYGGYVIYTPHRADLDVILVTNPRVVDGTFQCDLELMETVNVPHHYKVTRNQGAVQIAVFSASTLFNRRRSAGFSQIIVSLNPGDHSVCLVNGAEHRPLWSR